MYLHFPTGKPVPAENYLSQLFIDEFGCIILSRSFKSGCDTLVQLTIDAKVRPMETRLSAAVPAHPAGCNSEVRRLI